MSYYDPPDDEPVYSPLAEELAEKLTFADVNDDLAEEILTIIANLEAQLSQGCLTCARQADEAERLEAEKAAVECDLREGKCVHDEMPHECDACMAASDFAYDVAREQRWR